MRQIIAEGRHATGQIKQLLALLKDIVSDVNLDFEPDGVFVRAIDFERITITIIKLLNLSSYYYSSNKPHHTIGVSLSFLHRLLKPSNDSHYVKLRVYEDDPDTLEVSIQDLEQPSSSTMVAVPSMLLTKTRPMIPDIKYDFVVDIPIKRLQRAVRDASIASKHITIQALGRDGAISVKADGPFGNIVSTITAEEPGLFWMERPESGAVFQEQYFFKYLDRFLKTDIHNKVTLYMKQGSPLLMQVSIPFTGNISYYIASVE